MRTGLTKILFIFLSATLLSNVSIATTVPANSPSQSWRFGVWLDDKPIGYHRVSVNNESNRKTVQTSANFDVRFLFIPVYSYTHETRELWENGCLVNIISKTDDNGDDYFINSKQLKQQLELETRDGSARLDGCIRTFAYWDINLLKSERLLNTQTGEYQAVTITDIGTGKLLIDEDQVEARHFRLVVEDMTIDLWYTKAMRWLALESVTESGALLRYLPEKIADSDQETRS